MVTNCDHLARLRFSPTLPYAFTEHGVLAGHKELARKLEEREQKVASHDVAIRTLVAAIRQLAQPPADAKRRQIGFHARPEGKSGSGTGSVTAIARSRPLP